MSLVGSLEDLSLADLLQFFGLAQKSGLLIVRSGGGEGRIQIRDGRVCGARLVGGVSDLRALLVGGGAVVAADFEAAAAAAERRGVSLASLLVEMEILASETLEVLRRDHIEATVLRMFQWRVGEFEFDVGAKPDPADNDLCLSHGISAAYFAMEGARVLDEAAAHPSPENPAPAPPVPPTTPVVVVIDPDLAVLEWVKQSLADAAGRVHIFQRSELALERIRQYLARAEAPVVLLSREVEVDPLGGIRGAVDFARRLKAQAPRTRVLWLQPENADPGLPVPPADGVVVRPDPDRLADPGANPTAHAEVLRRALTGR